MIMAKQVTGYDGTFALQLRDLMDKNPKTGRTVTQKELAETVGVRAQTISLYINGNTQPTPETLVKMAEFFGVSVDYLLTGISSENKDINEEIGLSNEAINFLKIAKTVDTFDGTDKLVNVINNLLSDRDFYVFLEDLVFKMENLKKLMSGEFDKSHVEGLNVEGYFAWDLQKFVEEFVLSQIVKNGLAIEEKTIEMKSPKFEG